jgi:nucleotide-binding universal stress UspA family protein
MKLLLAVDESPYSDEAVQAVFAQADPHDTEVQVVHVIETLTPQLPQMMGYYPGIEHARDAQRNHAQVLVDNVAKVLRSKGIKVTTTVETGDPQLKILAIAGKWPADLIVVGSPLPKGLDRFLSRSLSETVLRHANCSVELVRRAPGGTGRQGAIAGQAIHVLLAIDQSASSVAASRLLIEQVHSREMEVRILHVLSPFPLLVARDIGANEVARERLWSARLRGIEDLISSTTRQVLRKDVPASSVMIKGDPKSRILEVAEQWPADLIVLGAHGFGTSAHSALGDVAETIAHNAHCSVEIARVPPSYLHAESWNAGASA